MFAIPIALNIIRMVCLHVTSAFDKSGSPMKNAARWSRCGSSLVPVTGDEAGAPKPERVVSGAARRRSRPSSGGHCRSATESVGQFRSPQTALPAGRQRQSGVSRVSESVS